jgi:cysteinyl-tRNA synthetase
MHIRRAIATAAANIIIPRNIRTISKMAQPRWQKPVGETHQPDLKIYNSLTRNKEPFVPIRKGEISWYVCGPTVYDDAHLGHARNYVTTDIIRRILRDYFGFKIRFVMNTTDVDDKIILRARQKHFYDQYKEAHRYIDNTVRAVAEEAWSYYVLKNLKRLDKNTVLSPQTFDALIESQYRDILDGGSLEPGQKPGDSEAKIKMHIRTSKAAAGALLKDPKLLTPLEFYNQLNDPMSLLLDDRYKNTIKGDDYDVFANLTKMYEDRFFQDMHDLNVLDPDDLVRVTEHGREIAEFVEKIEANNMAYSTTDGSVYFDIKAFEAAGYPYARLAPSKRNDKELLADGEGALSQSNDSTKKSAADFALWKASKAGEPSWPSKWGLGRPGWHIECSAMASARLGEQMDLHSGGIDLAFPHHDNELAQSEAFYANHRQWVNYFLHMGHLSIQGSKMSKSLKNFTTIREALHVRKEWTARSLRIIFLLGNWKDGIEITDEMANQGRNWEDKVDNFFLKAIQATKGTSSGTKTQERPEILKAAEASIKDALSDSFDTKTAMDSISELIKHYNNTKTTDLMPQEHLAVGLFVTHVVNLFGLNGSEPSEPTTIGWSGLEIPEAAKEYVLPLSQMRDELRQAAMKKSITPEKVQDIVSKSPIQLEDLATTSGIRPRPSYEKTLRDYTREVLQASENASGTNHDLNKRILELSDQVRDVSLWQLDIYLEDRDNGPALVRPVTEGLRAARREKEDRARAKEESKKQREREALEKLERGKLKAEQMFRPPHSNEYSAWNDKGLPTATIDGQPVSGNRFKKLQKQWDQQRAANEKYEEYLKVNGVQERAPRSNGENDAEGHQEVIESTPATQ